MSRPIKIAAVVGSLRAESFNRVLFGAVEEIFAGNGSVIEASVADVPLYNGDVEEAGDPPSVTELKQIVASADAVIFFTPEYNRSIPAVTKNAVDWLSRPFGTGPLAGKPVGIVASSPGGHDVAGVREHLAVAASGAGGAVYGESFGLGGVAAKITDGRLIDDETRSALREWLDGFVTFIELEQAARLEATGS